MKSRKIAMIIMTLSFILIISGGVSSFVLGLQQDRHDTAARVHEVNDIFEIFSSNTTAFENMRESLYSEVFENMYYDTMYQDNKKVKNVLSNYEQLVDELMKNTYQLNGLCQHMVYPDRVANTRCRNYKSIYEQVMNYFVSDIHLYNNNVQKYNDYQASQGTLFRIREYSTEKEFIDYNGDHQFDGKEE